MIVCDLDLGFMDDKVSLFWYVSYSYLEESAETWDLGDSCSVTLISEKMETFLINCQLIYWFID